MPAMSFMWNSREKGPSDGLNGAHQIEQAGALEVPVAPEIGAGRNEDVFDALRLSDEFGSNREKRRDRAAHVWCGHARAARLDVVAGRVFRDVGFQLTGGARDDLLARCD